MKHTLLRMGLGAVFCLASLSLYAQGGAARGLSPGCYTPGQKVTVSIALYPSGGALAAGCEDSPPEGWAISLISDGGVWDSVSRKVKFGPFFENLSRTVTYVATPPLGTSGEVIFSGLVSFNGSADAIGGTQRISTCPPPTETPVPPTPSATPSPTAAPTFPPGPGWSARSFSPSCYALGQPVMVSIQLNPPTATVAGACEDAPPAGWTVDLMSDGAVWDAADAKVKFGPFLDNKTRTVTYRVWPAANANSPVTFTGQVSFNGQVAAIEGAAVLAPCPPATETPSPSPSLSPTPWPSPYPSPIPSANWAARSFAPDCFTPSGKVTVTIDLNPPAGVLAAACEDVPPAGWTVSRVDDGGAYDAENGKVKFGPFFSNLKRRVTYDAVAPPDSPLPEYVFAGAVSYDGQTTTTGGAAQIAQCPPASPTPSPTPSWTPTPWPTAAPSFTPGTDWAERSFSVNCFLGFNVPVVVSIKLQPPAGALAIACDDTPPARWQVLGIASGGEWDPIQGKVKFGPFVENLARTVTYEISPREGAGAPYLFGGTVSVDGITAPVAGYSALGICATPTLPPPTPTDTATQTPLPPTPTPTPRPFQDTDGDGFSDNYEISVGSNPDDAADRPPLGDITGSGRTDLMDSIVLYRKIRAGAPLTDLERARGDVDLDGDVDIYDAIIIYRWALGVPDYGVLPPPPAKRLAIEAEAPTTLSP